MYVVAFPPEWSYQRCRLSAAPFTDIHRQPAGYLESSSSSRYVLRQRSTALLYRDNMAISPAPSIRTFQELALSLLDTTPVCIISRRIANGLTLGKYYSEYHREVSRLHSTVHSLLRMYVTFIGKDKICIHGHGSPFSF